MKTHQLFLALSLFFGFLFTFVTPPFQSPDEYNHYFRAFGIARGNLIPEKRLKTETINFYSHFLGMNEEASPYFVGSYLPEDLVYVVKNVSSDLPSNTSKKQDIGTLLRFIKYDRISNPKDIFVSYPNTSLYSPAPYTFRV